MVTARSSRLPRPRPRAGLPHLLGLVLLLLGLVCAHGAGGSHSTTDHATPQHPPAHSVTTRADAAAPAAGAPERHDPAHPVHHCVPLPPRAASAVDAPPSPAAPAEGCAPVGGAAPRGAVRAAGPAGDTAPAVTRSSAVLRV
ncbi:hypothetical protein ACIRBY_01340 [Streptomyces sp. NPDC096136]|uniref:hypothetical protein n=1 Tax=Streptomyces sp. NPDC096136 TaxID=3366076 RepID=UPI00382C514B